MTIAQPDATGSMKALSGIQVSVYQRDTTTPVTIYRKRDGATQGPATEAGTTGGPNPFVTGASGQIEFWAEGPAEIDVAIADQQAPARIPARTIGWNALPAALGSYPTGMLAGDANLALSVLGADVIRQLAQIGQVIEWWRPNDQVPIPSGWVICDGRQVPAGQHDFAGIANQAINVPDLRNTFILGAVDTKLQGQGAAQTDLGTDGPGIAGSGGSNLGKNFAHGHGVPGVNHLHTTADHLHGVGSLYTGNHNHGVAGAYVSGHNRTYQFAYGGSEAVPFANSVSQCYGGTDTAGNIGIGGTTGAADRALTTSGADRALDSATNSTTWTANPGTDMRPRFFGLLRIMKVRRA
jgi:hypothetical protein